ncbi:hypothetical protein [Pseudomonas sp. AU12215]|uniref:hypothetical protein n=1 Tax=Pseudomonas sp. AU12215 TaxID=1860123 RepID=UPI0007EE4A78|nr:hypothetical protein [Pseudomonas sp. AU12215]OBY48689.1 preprotein translocase subunit SecA [Pseudomonas sp. AU12215]
MTDAQQRLADVRAAIQEIINKGQAFTKGDRKLERARLDILQALESQYEAAVEAEAARGGRRPRAFRLYSAGKGV